MDDLNHALPEGAIQFRVLASGSSGNCSVIVVRSADRPRVFLVDAGLSPRRTKRLLKASGVDPELIAGIVLTHLDHDHWKPAWADAVGPRVVVHLHRRHAAAARRLGSLPQRHEAFDGAFELMPGVLARPALGPHDELGVVSYRFWFADSGGEATLGFATDIGSASAPLIEHLRGVDVLAIESNYCPDLQLASDRPEHLKRRIMGGSGHLSNHQCVRAVEAIEPRQHVVLLHLSRQCNHPELVAALHAGADYAVTVAHQEVPTRWIRLSARPASRSPQVQLPLFSMIEPAGAGG
jgi:phosphoribosyl 1,2-cyclic phosphodiesterase